MNKDRFFLPLILTIAAIKIVIMLKCQTYADGDESVIGVMALHILNRNDLPIYFWGQNYGGGSAVEAYLSSVVFALFGPSSIGLRTIPLILSICTVAFCYRLLFLIHSRRAAMICAILMATTSGLIEWFSKSRGGYVETSFYMTLVLLMISKMEGRSNQESWRYYAIGLVSGFAYYSQEIILPFLGLSFAYMSIVQWQKRSYFPLIQLGLGLIVGLIPVLVFNFTNDFANFRYIFGAASFASNSESVFFRSLFERLPALFQSQNFDGYPKELNWRTYCEAGIFLVLSLTMALNILFSVLKKRKIRAALTILAAYFVIVLPLSLLSQRALDGPRYYFMLFVPFMILTSVLLASAVDQIRNHGLSSYLAKFVCACGIFLTISGVWSHAAGWNSNVVVDDVWLPNGAIENRRSNGRDLIEVIEFLKSKEIETVRSPYFSQWRLIFESNETIIASSTNLYPQASRRDEFDRKVDESRTIAYVVHCESRLNFDFAAVTKSKVQFGDFCVYL
jgi:4-amino-4-deoxy-L-arabinose transferase-like glycosyltransferase